MPDPPAEAPSTGSAPLAKRPSKVTMGPFRALGVPLTYVLLIAILLYESPHLATAQVPVWAVAAVAVILVVYLARELSVFYVIDRRYLRAWRLFGWRKVRLSSIRKVEAISLRDLSPTGFSGLWGWRSRVWSPQVGKFDAIQTYHKGILVHGQGVPLFISPRDRDGFLDLLVARVRRSNPTVESPKEGEKETEGAPGPSSA